MSIIKPPRLQKGDLIGLVAPASTPSSAEKINKGVEYLERLGYRVKVGAHAGSVHGYLAGTDEERAGDLNEMFRDKNVKAVIAIRGGYGTPRILSKVDYAALKKHPKVIVGYSDLTALQMALFKKIGLVTFSGPMSGVEMWNGIDPYTEEHFWRLVTSPAKVGILANPQDEPVRSLKPGEGIGTLLGGNFSLFVSLMGTPFLPNLRKAVLILEDVDEAPHRVDRMLAQLKNAGILNGLSALLLGKFTDCNPSDPEKPFLTLPEIFASIVQEMSCPVVENIQYGHIPRKLTIPLGLRTVVKGERVEVVEGGVQ